MPQNTGHVDPTVLFSSDSLIFSFSMAIFIQASLFLNYPWITPLFIFLMSDHKKQLSHFCLHVPLVNAHLPKQYSELVSNFIFSPLIYSLSITPPAPLRSLGDSILLRAGENMSSHGLSWIKGGENCNYDPWLPNPIWVPTDRFTLYLKTQPDAWGAELGLEP